MVHVALLVITKHPCRDATKMSASAEIMLGELVSSKTVSY